MNVYPFYRQILPGVQQPEFFPGFPGMGGGFPSFPPTGTGPGFPPFGPPGIGGSPSDGFGQQQGPPSGPPPSFIPQESPRVGTFAVDPGGIRRCLHRFTFIRLTNGRSFWYFPVFVGQRSIAGWRWRPRQNRWEYFGIDLNRISSFSCF